MKVYVLTAGEYHYHHFEGVYSTMERAIEAACRISPGDTPAHIEEVEIDSRMPDDDVRTKSVSHHHCCLDRDGKDAALLGHTYSGLSAMEIKIDDRGDRGMTFEGFSARSLEEATELASKARQACLRNQVQGVA